MPVTVNGLNITDNINYLVEEVTYKSAPTRTVISQAISRRPGDKLLGVEWENKTINIKGRVFGTTISGLIGNVDILQQNFAVQSLALSIDNGRTYTATLTRLDIPTQFFNNTMIQYDADFLSTDPFAYGQQVTCSGTTVSGTLTVSGIITISGTVFAEPILTIIPKGANAGNSGLKGLQFTHVPTGEILTISGTFSYNSDIIIDFHNFAVTISGVVSDYSGIFSRFEPGAVNYLITTISGVRQGYNYKWSYSPRFYQ